ncbi:hypothetical protein [Sporosarcina sp. FSL K6-3457]|uniref:hypothetical protein n=1 Tax=Sporosarcina sp. FSL K6-3457 TaxID=2978204 RepID=UPI0030F76FE2
MKTRKKLFTFIITLVASIFLVVPNSAFANSSVSDTVNGVNLYGLVNIGANHASASTSASESVYMRVDLTYTYGIAGTTREKSISGSDSGFKTGVSAFLDPIEFGSTSVRANAVHTWTLGNIWTRNTAVNY